MMRNDPIIVTGIGAITSIGANVESTWEGLLTGRSGVKRIRSFDVSRHASQVGCEIENIESYFLHHQPAGRATSLLLLATEDALHDARMTDSEGKRIGICVGTTMGEIAPFEEVLAGNRPSGYGGTRVIGQWVADELNLTGPRWTITNACAAGNIAIMRAMEELWAGRADVMVAAGVDAMSWIAYTGFGSIRALSSDVCRPFDRNRKGLLLGEGAGVLILERYSTVVQRGGPVRASILGYGANCDAHHITQPDPGAYGSIRAMNAALEMAGVNSGQIGYVSAHGTGTLANDRMESKALNDVFGGAIRTSSIKGHIGHTLGAASAIEAAMCVKVLETGLLPPTLNLISKDPDCQVDVIAGEPVQADVDYVLSNAYAFGGINTSVIFGQAREM
ncbi:beta-ketoacyl-[acyl-carrier-protein] synthase family protein [Paenibacillus sp. SYP-B4298]|uniref:beta-ketoacyl-[acyl-carrier-protein] synthase family protein n=1 Tax=Paenibacillus sp. SYP-B4298 TaxID=2996034 RepID=UPI0022DD3552|nr:beta-ketoacyl-[acyl-carrier-protein] synthase family protein [Paenibacillus sp. SYP-B4298]